MMYTTTFKNHPIARDTLHNKNHLDRIFSPSNIEYSLRRLDIEIPKVDILSACQPACLNTVARLEAKQSNAQPPFYIIITNSPGGCTFWGSDECVLHLQSGCSFSSSCNETISRHIFFPG